jgi:ABC-type lipoprotein export system ATPase subunit
MIEFDGVTVIYDSGPVKVRALGPVDLLGRGGDLVAIMGPSGSGKSTTTRWTTCCGCPPPTPEADRAADRRILTSESWTPRMTHTG